MWKYALVLVVLSPATAAAQYAWDAAAFGGLLVRHSPVPDNQSSYEDWFSTGQYGAAVGRHLTRHLKVEFEAAGSGTGHQSVFRYGVVPGSVVRYSISGRAETTVRWLTASATWQFLDNQWIHPFVMGGVSALAETRSLHIWEQPIYVSGPPVPGVPLFVPEQHEGPDTSVSWKPVMGAGAKFYLSPRAFIRSDARVTLGAAPHAVAFRAGVGVDF